MYESFYGLSKRPFTLTPDPSFLYLSDPHAQALSTLQYGMMSEAGVTVVTGEVGTGKTTLLRELLRDVDENCTVGVISNTHAGFGELLSWILMAFDVAIESRDKAVMYNRLIQFLTEEHLAERRAVLIVDEAQNLNIEQLEELRLLSNLNMGDSIILQLVLVGQPELAEMLTRDELRQFSQRISVEFHIPLLNLEQTAEYISHRLATAGGDPELFSKTARFGVFYHSRGVPRLINNICDLALAYGFGDEKDQIDLDTIEKVMRSKKITRHHLRTTPASECAEKLRADVQEKKGVDIAEVQDDDDWF